MNTVGSHLHVESEQEKLIEIRNRLVVSRVEGEMDIGQKYKLELEDEWALEKRVTTVNKIVSYTWKFLRR